MSVFKMLRTFIALIAIVGTTQLLSSCVTPSNTEDNTGYGGTGASGSSGGHGGGHGGGVGGGSGR